MSPPGITQFDFELAYLVLLTRYGLKPLSRWEKPISDEARKAIRSEGLALETVDRRTRIGRSVHETVFAKRRSYTDLYRRRFEGTRLKDTPDVTRMQGQLFGYPSCCVEAFIKSPYAPNEIDPADQEMLFHWACPSCHVTPGLIRDYRRIHMECLQRYGTGSVLFNPPARRLPMMVTRVAASLALMAGTAAFPAAAQNPHWLYVADDLDQDYLSVAEEVISGNNWETSDTDENQILDGVQIALLLGQLINSPPLGVEIEDHLLMGLEECFACGQEVNMGYMTIQHLWRGLSVDIPYIALHYLEHGSLGYYGFFHLGRVDLHALIKILMPHLGSTDHLLPTGGIDPDNDYLNTEEEPPFNTDPADADTDDDTVKDGPQVSEELLPLIAQLPREAHPDQPYMLELQMDGVEQCEICGATFNMGLARIVNPLEGLSVNVPFVGLHTLAHGGFVFDGTYNDGRVLPSVLKTVLSGDGTAHWVPVDLDSDGDGLTDAEEPFFGLDPTILDENNNGMPDGRELASVMAASINSLPRTPMPESLYAIDHMTHGIYTCLVCGEPVNMGFVEVVDPVENSTLEVPYYNIHFMGHGSFSTDRDDLYPRVDPTQIGAFFGITSIVGVEPKPAVPGFSILSAPNPFGEGTATQILLSLPAPGPLSVSIYDVNGRKIRELFNGPASQSGLLLRWDGRNDGGELVGSGVYFCRAKIGKITVARKLTMVR
ncbi:MAG: T9SS type A sorting domain-containing protein [Candidatus Latescibacteria bacterium]|nr:T9SS type A sorting domain-containing protein [Candidatus Latescibacterota bacterium]NIO56303.1 T9SS type A sorting domain-containing protein [Candidatus Latescibacterota bacterium]